MCNQIIAIVSRDGKKVYLGTGSHHALAKQKKIRLSSHSIGKHSWLFYESDGLSKGPMKLNKSGNRSGGAGFVNASWGSSTKAADKAAKEAFHSVLKDADSLGKHIAKYGLDDYSIKNLFSDTGRSMITSIAGGTNDKVANENYRLKKQISQEKAKAALVSLKFRRDKHVRQMVNTLNADLAKKHPKYRPTLEFSAKPKDIEASGRELAEYGFMTIPEVKSFVDSVIRFLANANRKITDANYKVRYPTVSRSVYAQPSVLKNANSVHAMVFSQPEFRAPAWKK